MADANGGHTGANMMPPADRGVFALHRQTCALLTANVPSSVGYLYKFATRADPEDAASRRSLPEAADKAAVMRESALKSCIFVGVPRVRGAA